MVNQVLQQSKDWVLRNKASTFLSVALFAMIITTIALSVSNNNNASDLDQCRAAISSTTQIPSNGETTTTSDEQNTDSTEEGATTTTQASMETSPLTTTEAVTTVETTTTTDPEDGINYRLPVDTVPLHYDLLLHPDLEAGTFTGRTTITVLTVRATDQIVLHSHLLDVRSITFKSLNESSIVFMSSRYDEKLNFLQITLSRALSENFISELTLEFGGPLDEQIVGFYSSSYKSDTGAEIKIATSKFEPTFARQAFPCFDEPQLKAEYTIHLVHPEGNDYEALSNMNVKETVVGKPSAGLSTTTFERSVSMSTYLVVFIVSDFTHREVMITPIHGDKFPLRVYATRYQESNTMYALTTARKVIEHYVDYFGIPYPLPKLDMAAIPDFVSGAMETWGLVTYRETSILYNSETSSTANKQRVAGVIAHELAHMWFGNLVTMKWWNELWLNEGFASYIEYKGIEAAEPTWGIEEQFLIDDLHGVLNLDATIGSHPIVVSVESPNQITEIFDTITYSKGASVIRMLEDFVNPEVFRQGVTNYLKRLSFGNGVSEDLMKELDELVPDVSVSAVMDTFTKQKGLPVVTVRRLAMQYILTQQRFLADKDANEPEVSPFEYRWYIPITYVSSTSKDTVQRAWFRNDAADLTIEMPGSTDDGWIKLNYRQIGYYRVNYPVDMWEKFGAVLRTDVNTFTIGDRTGLLNDAFALADASMLNYNYALDLTRYLSAETEYVPWSAISSKLKTIRNLLYNFNSYDDITKYTQKLVTEVVNQVGWVIPEEGGHMQNLLRSTILDLACSFGHEDCLAEAGKQFRDWLDNSKAIHPDLRSIVYTYGIQSGVSVADWNHVLDRFQAENDANEKTKLMVALASYPDQRTMRRFLDLAWEPSIIRTQDQLSCIQYIAANRHGEQAAWEHVRENWERLVARFTLGERNLGRMIPSVTGRFTTRARLLELQDFFARYPDAGAGVAARRQALETIENNISWLQRNEANVAAWLEEESAPQLPA